MSRSAHNGCGPHIADEFHAVVRGYIAALKIRALHYAGKLHPLRIGIFQTHLICWNKVLNNKIELCFSNLYRFY